MFCSSAEGLDFRRFLEDASLSEWGHEYRIEAIRQVKYVQSPDLPPCLCLLTWVWKDLHLPCHVVVSQEEEIPPRLWLQAVLRVWTTRRD